jgi:hypothetical protein
VCVAIKHVALSFVTRIMLHESATCPKEGQDQSYFIIDESLLIVYAQQVCSNFVYFTKQSLSDIPIDIC